MSLNQAQIIGYLGKDPEVRYLPNGDAVANFSIATSEKWKDKTSGEPREETEWHRISVFGRLAEIVGEYLKKGSLVFVQGKLKTRKWQDKDGNDKYSTEVVLNGFNAVLTLLDKPAESEEREPAPQTQHTKPTTGVARRSQREDMDDEIPF